jgi:adenylate cyclase class 2
MNNQEIEVRFLEIDVEDIKQKLHAIGAQDAGEDFLEEIIFYDKEFTWSDQHKMVRLRTRNGKTHLTYKHQHTASATGTEEIEFEVTDKAKAEVFLERLGYPSFRHQEKKRHTFEFGDVVFDIDTWPRVPSYIEIEGPSEEALKDAANKLGLDWKDVVFDSPRTVLETRYNIPIMTMKWFTFNKFE